MRAAWYDQQGESSVLRIGELPDPEPGPGELRVRVRFSGINPGDTKKRRGWLGSQMPYPRVIPHSDGSGVVDRLGDGVAEDRLGQRVWVYGAQSYRPFGTAAEYVVVPAQQAVALGEVPEELGACLGIPGITAHRCLLGDGPVAGRTVLIQGVLGAVGRIAAQLARHGGARVIGTVRRERDLAAATALCDAVVALDGDDPARAVRDVTGGGVDRIVEVSFAENLALDAAVLARYGTIAAYGTGDPSPSLPFWPMLFENQSIRLYGSDDFPASAKQAAARDLTAAAAEGRVGVPVAEALPLDRIGEAHDRVDAGSRDRVLLDLG